MLINLLALINSKREKKMNRLKQSLQMNLVPIQDSYDRVQNFFLPKDIKTHFTAIFTTSKLFGRKG